MHKKRGERGEKGGGEGEREGERGLREKRISERKCRLVSALPLGKPS